MRGPFELLEPKDIDVGERITERKYVTAEEANGAIAQDKEVYVELGEMLKQALDELMATRTKLAVAKEALFNIENMRPHQLLRETVKKITRDAREIIRREE